MFFNLFSHRDDDWKWTLQPIKYAADDKMNYTGKLILPQGILKDLVMHNITPPYTFEIKNPEVGLSTNCGVLEFTGADSIVLVPLWIFQQLSLEYASQAEIRFKRFKNGSFLKLLPHNVVFLELEAPKLELEKCLREYQVLSRGDEIVLNFEEYGPMRFTVVELKPNKDAIYIVDRDIKVDFLPPLGYEQKLEDEKSVKKFVTIEGEGDHKIIRMEKLGIYFVDD